MVGTPSVTRKGPILDHSSRVYEIGEAYRGVAMSSIGILAWRGALAGGDPLPLPNFNQESQRKAFESDHWSPWQDGTGDGQAPPSILGWPKPSRKGLAHAKKVWKEIGFKGK